MASTTKQIQIIILDAGPILKNEPAISSLLAKSEHLVTTPAVIAEIKDFNARRRLETTMEPFLTIRSPNLESLKFVTEFARRTGDLSVLSKTDLQVLALVYECECELSGGDCKLRKAPGQKSLNGLVPERPTKTSSKPQNPSSGVANTNNDFASFKDSTSERDDSQSPALDLPDMTKETPPVSNEADSIALDKLSLQRDSGSIEKSPHRTNQGQDISQKESQPTELEADSSDSDGWITPANLKKTQAKAINASTSPLSDLHLAAACITSDFAMQNVLLQIGLNLLSPSLQRVRNIRTYVLRCHACFAIEKNMTKQFCYRCGKPSLTRVSCSTNQKGQFQVHLKKNMQWHHRGDRFSIPKPVPGAANGRVGKGKGGGKGGWGQELILAEDQKEYLRAMDGRNREKQTDLMDDNYLPGILTGDRGKFKERPKIGGGRNVNSKRRA